MAVTDQRIVSLLRGPYLAALSEIETRLAATFPDLRPAHFIVFQLIELPPGGSRLTELADRARMTKPSMLELVDGLEQRGYVERTPDASDRRAKIIRLTPRGLAAFEGGFHAVNDLQADWARRLGDDRFELLFTLLQDLNGALGLREPGSGGPATEPEAGSDPR
jgi:DNA-binding MarR family transcriptional regulator